MTDNELTDLLLYKVNNRFVNEIDTVARNVWYRLENKIEIEMESYLDTLSQHQGIPGMRNIYRDMRNEIIEQNYMKKGEFTTHYAKKRGRL